MKRKMLSIVLACSFAFCACVSLHGFARSSNVRRLRVTERQWYLISRNVERSKSFFVSSDLQSAVIVNDAFNPTQEVGAGYEECQE